MGCGSGTEVKKTQISVFESRGCAWQVRVPIRQKMEKIPKRSVYGASALPVF